MNHYDERDYDEEAANAAAMREENESEVDELVCPHCLSGEHLRSVEKVSIAYPVTFTTKGMDYTGGETTTYDEESTFVDEIDCKNCGTYGMARRHLVVAR